jgi:hypothetical protein
LPLQQTQVKQYKPAVYTQRSPNILKAILKNHFQSFSEKYSENYDTELGKIRLSRIETFKDSLISCGDYTKGIARIQCSNPECKHEIFRPFSCKRFYFCPSCSQKRSILFGEHISEEVLLKLPRRHFVFAFPKMLRLFFRNNKKVLRDIAVLISKMIQEYYKALTGKNIRTGIVLAFQSYGDFLRFNPHFHSLILEGGFDEDGNFIFIPITDLVKMKELFRQLVIEYFIDAKLLSQELANNLLSWKHSGLSIDNSIKIAASDNKAREAIAQYMARCPVSFNKIIYEPFKSKVIFKTKYNKYFKENLKVYDADKFIARLTQHIPLPRIRLIRYFDLYSSKSRGKWKDWEHVSKLAPLGWKEENEIQIQDEEKEIPVPSNGSEDMSVKKSKATWARLIAKIYEVDPLTCPKCGSEMKILSVIMDTNEIKKILKHLMKTNKAPPGVDEKDLLDE